MEHLPHVSLNQTNQQCALYPKMSNISMNNNSGSKLLFNLILKVNCLLHLKNDITYFTNYYGIVQFYLISLNIKYITLFYYFFRSDLSSIWSFRFIPRIFYAISTRRFNSFQRLPKKLLLYAAIRKQWMLKSTNHLVGSFRSFKVHLLSKLVVILL